jgi:hypothetical protein
MTTRTQRRPLEWPEVIPLSAQEREDFRTTCAAISAKGSEAGEIARDMLAIEARLTSLIIEVDAFLAARRI